MNSIPKFPTVANSRGYLPEFGQLIREKSENFVGREFVFASINKFFPKGNLGRADRGYFTLVGAPGSGKSALLAKYVSANPDVIYYNAQVEGKNRADKFLRTICNQLMGMGSGDGVVPDNVTEGSWFLSVLLQEISDRLSPDQRLIIAIDSLDAIAPNSQPASSNLFYLPRYLPQRVYFLLARRPFLKERSGLLIETPSQIFDLAQYPQQNREDIEAYIRQFLSTLTQEGTKEESVGIGEAQLCDRLTENSENNFMYLSQILKAIAPGEPSAGSILQNLSPTSWEFEPLPTSLETYYQSHWQRMITKGQLRGTQQNQDFSSVELALLNILVQQTQPISIKAIAQITDEDEYEIEEVLENWIEFLQPQQISGETHYHLYHSSFRNWLSKQLG
jgi:hypothetical protein